MGSGTSAASPQQLTAAGSAFRRLTNTVTGIASTEDLQAGGGYEEAYVAADDVSLAASVSDFDDLLCDAAKAFLSVLIAAAPQCGDAAVDLMDCGGAFASADTGVPAGAQPVQTDSGPAYAVPDPHGGYDVYYEDSEGHVVVERGVPVPAPPETMPTAPGAPSSGTPSSSGPSTPSSPSPTPTPTPTP